MITTAIAAGNAVILKPSEKDPSAAVFLAQAFKDAGLPDGVLNVVHGDRTAVEALLAHRGISGISFVGSTPIARHIYARSAEEGKRVQALGGAKNHMVVMPDAHLDSAADAAVSAAYGSAGERCMAVSVVVAVGDIADELVGRIRDRAQRLVVADGTDSRAEMGPLITAEALERVTGYVAGAQEEGAELVVDGRGWEVEGEGYFIGPSLIDHVTPGMRVYDEEIFGPVLSVVRVDTYDDAVALINANRFANGTALFTRDGKTAREFEFDIEVGMVGVNVPIRCRWEPSASADGRTRSSGTPICTGRRLQLLHPAQSRHPPLARAQRFPDQSRIPHPLAVRGACGEEAAGARGDPRS